MNQPADYIRPHDLTETDNVDSQRKEPTSHRIDNKKPPRTKNKPHRVTPPAVKKPRGQSHDYRSRRKVNKKKEGREKKAQTRDPQIQPLTRKKTPEQPSTRSPPPHKTPVNKQRDTGSSRGLGLVSSPMWSHDEATRAAGARSRGGKGGSG